MMYTPSPLPTAPYLRIMVVMPHPWKGGFFRVAAKLCNELLHHDYYGQRFQVFLGVPAEYEIPERHILDDKVVAVQLAYESVNLKDERFLSSGLQQHIHALDGCTIITPSKSVTTGDSIVLDTVDAFIMLSTLYAGGVFTTEKPYSVFAADFIQRYVPEIYTTEDQGYNNHGWELDRNQRIAMKNASCVFATTPQTLEDVRSYAGIDEHKTLLFPMFAVDVDAMAPSSMQSQEHDRTILDHLSGREFKIGAEPYFLWVTNASAHKNHRNAFQSLRHFYENLGGKTKCIICGPVTDNLKPGFSTHPYHLSIYKILDEWPDFEEHVRIATYIDDLAYSHLLRKAQFLWHNVIQDNGTFSIIEASLVGTPILTSSYPQLDFIMEKFAIEAQTFSPFDVIGAAVALKEMEQSAANNQNRRQNSGNSKERADTKARVERENALLGGALNMLLDKMFSPTRVNQ